MLWLSPKRLKYAIMHEGNLVIVYYKLHRQVWCYVLQECDDGIHISSSGEVLKQDGCHDWHTRAAADGLHLLKVCLKLRIVRIRGGGVCRALSQAFLGGVSAPDKAT